ncbi:MAG: TIGR04013 family B12-binding domain/radical SAM domain-containing protein [Chloroflexota bacterium]
MKQNAVLFVIEGYNRYSIAALAGTLEQEMPEIDLLFCKGSHHFAEAVETHARAYQQLVVAFSFMSPQLPQVIKTLDAPTIKPDNVTYVAGGPHPSGDSVGTLDLGIDVVVTGEGEVAFPALLRQLFSNESITEVPGLAYYDNDGKIVRQRRARWVELDDYPPFSIVHRKLAAIEITRGCPWACSFCQTPFYMGGKMRYRSVEQIVYWLQQAKEKADARYARFISADCFSYGSPNGRTPDLDQVAHLLHEVSAVMGRENTFFGSFPSEVRPGSVSREGLALLKKYSANDNIVIGAQSGSLDMLQRMHRGHSVEDVLETVELIVAADLRCIVDFIFGLPGETAEDRELTIQLMETLADLGATINTHFFMPLPGTPLANSVIGIPDPETIYFLERMTSEKSELGRWKGRLKSIAAMQEVVPLMTAG